MKYFYNYEADAVVREDEQGRRYKKSLDMPYEGYGQVSEEDDEAWGIPSYGRYNLLEPITKEQYDTFAKTWAVLDGYE